MSLTRQGTWMIVCTTVAGVFMFGVHLLAFYLGEASYGLFLALLGLVNFSMIPAPGLQTIFARQAAAIQNEADHRALIANMIGVLMVLTLLWAGLGMGFFVAKDWALTSLKMEDARALWITLAAILPHLWLPVFFGVLQGRQHFGYLGWAVLSNGLGRFTMLLILFLLFGKSVEWAMTAPLFGASFAVALAAFACRDLFHFGWQTPKWRQWLWRALCIALGPGMLQFMLSADMLAARVHFDKETSGYYGMSAMVGRGLVMFVSPMAGVMFSKLVSEKSLDKMAKLICTTARITMGIILFAMILGTMIAFALPTILEWAKGAEAISQSFQSTLQTNQELLFELARIVASSLLAMSPLALANVFISHLVAREAFGKIAVLGIIVLGYALGLGGFSFSVPKLILWIGIGNALLLIGAYGLSRRLLQTSKKSIQK